MPVNIDTKSLAGQYLPSVYFSEISIKEGGLSKNRRKKKTNKGIIIDLDLIIRDVVETDEISTWMLNSDFTRFLKIKIIQSTSPRLTKVLSRGNLGALRLPKFKKHSKTKILTVQKNDFDLKDYTKIHSSDGERIYEIPYSTKMMVEDKNPEHLCYFAFVFLDIQDMAKNYGLSFGQNKIFKGTISKEKVISNSQVNTTAYVFYLSETNQIWSGKVHKKESGWFTGAKSSKITSPLRRQKITNGKIKDYRDVEKVNGINTSLKPAKKSYQKSQKRQLNRNMFVPRVVPSYISQGIVSPKQNGNTSVMFHVDIRKWIREQSAFGSIIDNSTNKRSVEEIYFLSRIKQLKLLRRRIEKTPSINRLGTTTTSIDFDPSRQAVQTIVFSSDKNGFLKKEKSKVGAIREIQNLAFTGGVRTFTAEDFSMKDITDGLYQYGVEIEAVDGTVVFLNRKLDRLIAAKKQLDLYYNDAICPKYVLENGKFKPTLAKKYKKLRKKPWNAAIAVYIDVYSSLGRLPRNKKIMAKKLFAMTNPTSGTEAGIYGLLTMMQQLIDQMINSLGSKRQQSYTLNTKMSIKSSSTSKASGGAKLSKQFKVSTLTINTFFKDTHDSNIPKNFGIDFIGKQGVQDIGTRAILFSDFDDRIAQENSIYWKGDLEKSSNLLRSESSSESESTAPDISPILDLSAVEYGYLTPSTVSAGPITLDRMNSGESIWSSEQYNTITSTIISTNSGNPPSTNTLSMTRPEGPEDQSSSTTSMTRPYSNTTIKSGNNISSQVSSASKNNLLNQLGVVIVEPTEENLEEFSSLSAATKKKLLVSVDKILAETDPLNQISEEPCNNHLDTDNEQIKERKRKEVKKRNSENKSAVSDVFMSNLASSGVLNPSNTTQSSPFTQSLVMPIENYDLSTTKNVVDSIRKSPLKKRQIEGIPNQMRSLMFSRSDATKNNWLDQNQDPLKSPETSQMMRYNYSTFGKIEVFMGFEKDKDGNNIILKPIFRMLNKKMIKRAKGKQLMCRVENYKNKSLGIGDNSLDMRIFDNCFIMSPSAALAMANKSRVISKKQKSDTAEKNSPFSLTGIPGVEVTLGNQLWSIGEKQENPKPSIFSKETEVSDEQYNKLSQYVESVKIEEDLKEKYDKEYEKKTDKMMTGTQEQESIEEEFGPTVEDEITMELLGEDAISIEKDFPNETVDEEKGIFDTESEDSTWGFIQGESDSDPLFEEDEDEAPNLNYGGSGNGNRLRPPMP